MFYTRKCALELLTQGKIIKRHWGALKKVEIYNATKYIWLVELILCEFTRRFEELFLSLPWLCVLTALSQGIKDKQHE